MEIILNRNGNTPIYLQIKNQIKQKIISKELGEDYRLPSERMLSKQLEVDRSTVVKAYMELKAEGLVQSFVGKGTVVIPQVSTQAEFDKLSVPKIYWNQWMKQESSLKNQQFIAQILENAHEKDMISFAGGIPSSDTYPIETIKQIQKECMDQYKEKLFMPTSVYGCMPLRENIKKHIAKRGIQVSTKEIMITSGVQQGIYYFAKLFIEQGDMVLVEEPSYLGAIEIFKAAGAKVIGVPVDANGMKIDILENLLIRYRPKFIYTQPSFQNPSGATLSLSRRKELLKLAYFYQIPILEDDSYGEISYGESTLSLKALDKNDYVIYLGSFSKSLCLGMRIGWVIANDAIIERFGGLKQITDLHSNTMAQYVLSEFLQQGYYSNHLKEIRKQYEERKNLMISELKKYKVDGLEWNEPDPFYSNGTIGDVSIRLNYTYPSKENIKEGIKRLVNAIKKAQIKRCPEWKMQTNNQGPIF